MPNTITYSNPTSARPDASILPPFLQGAQYVRDRANYEDQVSLQDILQRMGVQKQQALQPSQIEADLAKNQATALTAVPEAIHKTEGLRLGNLDTLGNIKTKDLEREIKSKEEERANLRRGFEMASVLRGVAAQGSPAAMASVKQRLGKGTDEISKFINDAVDNNDLMDRIDHVMQIYKSMDMEYQRALLSLEQAKVSASTKEPNPWNRHIDLAASRIRRENPGMSQQQALELASREVRTLQSGEEGVRQRTPEAAGAAALAEQVAKFKAQLGWLPEGPARNRIEEHIRNLEREITNAQRPRDQQANHSMADLRKMYPGRSDKEIKDAYKARFGVEPK